MFISIWFDLYLFFQFAVSALLRSREKLLEKRRKLRRVYLFQQKLGELNENKLNIKYVEIVHGAN